MEWSILANLFGSEKRFKNLLLATPQNANLLIVSYSTHYDYDWVKRNKKKSTEISQHQNKIIIKVYLSKQSLDNSLMLSFGKIV